ncbi:MAG: hypothetical protein L6V80_05760 [Bacteroidales bacterium]|nr:MAG: hypothetical protein L6V80_05760 [Bacteroidales bacterium]
MRLQRYEKDTQSGAQGQIENTVFGSGRGVYVVSLRNSGRICRQSAIFSSVKNVRLVIENRLFVENIFETAAEGDIFLPKTV